MADEKITEESVEVDEIEAPVSAICNNAEELAADLVDDDSEIKLVEVGEGAVQHFPTYKVPNGENLPVGEYIGWTSPRNIEPIPAKVVSVENQVATIDFNHPLAGKDIVYWVKLLDVSD